MIDNKDIRYEYIKIIAKIKYTIIMFENIWYSSVINTVNNVKYYCYAIFYTASLIASFLVGYLLNYFLIVIKIDIM